MDAGNVAAFDNMYALPVLNTQRNTRDISFQRLWLVLFAHTHIIFIFLDTFFFSYNATLFCQTLCAWLHCCVRFCQRCLLAWSRHTQYLCAVLKTHNHADHGRCGRAHGAPAKYVWKASQTNAARIVHVRTELGQEHYSITKRWVQGEQRSNEPPTGSDCLRVWDWAVHSCMAEQSCSNKLLHGVGRVALAQPWPCAEQSTPCCLRHLISVRVPFLHGCAWILRAHFHLKKSITTRRYICIYIYMTCINISIYVHTQHLFKPVFCMYGLVGCVDMYWWLHMTCPHTK